MAIYVYVICINKFAVLDIRRTKYKDTFIFI